VPGSIRRTTSIDMLRPGGVDGELVLIGMGRDLVTSLDGDTAVVDAGAFEATVDYANAQRVVALASTPAVAGLDRLVGRSASTGFRAALNEVVAGQDLVGRPVYQLLDDLPVATLISGYSPQQAMAARSSGRDAPGRTMPRRAPEGLELIQQADLCAGWKAGGTIMLGMAAGVPPVVTGPDAPALDRADDPWAWHEVPGALPALGMRRRRRIDVEPAPDDATVLVDAHFRDSHMDDEGAETIVHEYVIGLVLDGRDLRVVDSSATPRVLPWFECPEAAGSAERLVGRPLDGLRASVRAEFLGTSTCTHLNDALRALEDVPALVRHL
jgi:Protein of unknown function (DUF2889)